uniref:Failed axon connections-like protein n=1 Tax=Magallana gigas TaxID=29159 RepID=K1PUB7_MAGGI
MSNDYNVHDSFKNRSSKGKMTWIEYNGEEIADSELCIDYIKDKFQVDVNSDYTPEQLASGFMVQKMVEDHLYWTLILYRYVYEGALRLSAYRSFSFLFRYMAKWKVLKDSKAHGIGRHSTKKFLLGEQPSQVDCSVFGMLSQFYWHGFGDPTEETIKKFPNLCQYCERTKTEFWPDWDKCITHGESGQTVK